MKNASRGPLIDTEKCIRNVGGNKFEMILIAAIKARALLAKTNSFNHKKDAVNTPVTALLEIQQGILGIDHIKNTEE